MIKKIGFNILASFSLWTDEREESELSGRLFAIFFSTCLGAALLFTGAA
jgi:hypothetical protein